MSIAAAFIMPHPPVILPGIGGGDEKNIQKTIDACDAIGKKIGEIKPDIIVLTSPHCTMYNDYFHISPGKGAMGDFGKFGAKEISMHVEYDTEFVKALEEETEKNNINAGTLGEKETSLDHGTMVPLSFVNKYYTSYKLVRISLSGLSKQEHYRLGNIIATVSNYLKRKVVFIGSGDLSHKLKDFGPYGFSKEGPLFDMEIVDIIEKGELNRLMDFDPVFAEKAAECGLGSFVILAGTLEGIEFDSRLLSYEGPFGVGYGVGEFIPRKEEK